MSSFASLWESPYPVWMGIINISHNSDTDRFQSPDAALRRAQELIKQGAHILDIGATATNPLVENCLQESEEEFNRLLPVLEKIRTHCPGVPISVDTFSPSVALRLAQQKLMDVVNDIYAAQWEENHITTAHVAGQFGLGFIAMHMAGELTSPQCTQMKGLSSADTIDAVSLFLEERVQFVRACGVQYILVDPGIGSGRFGKSTEQSYALLSRVALNRFSSLQDAQLLVGVSRKRFIREGFGHDFPINDPVFLDKIDSKSKSIEFNALQNGAKWIRSHKMPQEISNEPDVPRVP